MRFGIFALALLSVPALADEVPDRLEGVWESAADPQPQIDAAIRRALDEMSFIKRPFARPRLEKATAPCAEVRIWETAAREVAIQCDDRPPAVAPPDGSVVTYVTEDDETYDLSYELVDDAVIQTFYDPDGSRRIVYAVRDHQLHMRVSLISDHLPRDITYTEVFSAR